MRPVDPYQDEGHLAHVPSNSTERAPLLAAGGSARLSHARQEPHGAVGQTVSRLLSPEGFLLGINFTPALRDPPAR